jgi:SagB-type dehydrogenase family enzyme
MKTRDADATLDPTLDPTVTVSLSLIDGASLVDEGPMAVSVRTSSELHLPPVSVEPVTPGLRLALRALEGEGASPASLAVKMLELDGPAGFVGLQRAIALLDRHTLLSRTVFIEKAPLASIHPLSIYYRHDDNVVEPDQRYTLSRFACCRKDGARMTVESPLGYAQVRLHSEKALAALGTLAEPRTSAGAAERVAGLTVLAVRELMNLLANAGALLASPDSALGSEDTDPTRAQWEFHDLFFHTRSRLGRHANPYGGTYRFKGRFDPLPAIKPPMSREIVPLERPDLERLGREDRPFSAVLEARRSVRQQGEPPISHAQLGEFLYRAARVQNLAREAEVSFRPSPAGGAIHELEIYPIVNRCDGLAAGLYHYDALEHRLEAIQTPGGYLDTLLRMAASTAELEHPPQVLLVVAARFQRMQWKYQSMAYNVILKNVGALYQTMYLVATAMGLAPCSLGGGHSDLFAAAAGLDYLAESSVGEFILGSARG